jgi:RimJ/RimL family protein N-acetyltransferase
VRTAVRWLERRGVREVVAVIVPHNISSANVVERVGFIRTGSIEHSRLGAAVRWSLSLPSAWSRSDRLFWPSDVQ